MEKVKFEIEKGGLCLTDCPHGLFGTLTIIRVYSDSCKLCRYYSGGNKKKKIVNCSYNDKQG